MLRREFFAAAAAPAIAAAQAIQPARSLNLKITGIKTIVVNVGSVNWVFCKISTNQGVTGLGEGSVTSKEATVSQAILEQERFLTGKDPSDIELLWQGMFRYPRWRGGPILNSAISAVEIALWDILGKALDMPIYKLIGGAARQRIRMYKDVGSTPEAFLQAKSEGYTAAKSGFITVEHDVVRPGFAVREAVRKLEAVRKAVGDDFDICIDAHGQLTTVMAVDFCTRIEDLHPMFVEEPTQLEDLGELALLRQKTKVPLATGERLFTKYGFIDLCSRHLVNYVQPDVCHAGGILELKKIGAIAETFRIEMAPHNPQSEVSTLASLHVSATTPACTAQEYSPKKEPWIQDLFYGGAVKVNNGYAELPTRPGLGVDIDERVAAKHPYKPVTRPNYVFPDGSVADY
ncbi:MAG TPA: enolase C-terminal domain-like protein [Bryobacteraceae bacterium]|nr:enolase C-terminal domain-like protein [Bryobacteraceae bacterium]